MMSQFQFLRDSSRSVATGSGSSLWDARRHHLGDTGSDGTRTPTQDSEPLDRYTAGIELSNACRRFYVARLEAAERAKNRLGLKVKASTRLEDIDPFSRQSTPDLHITPPHQPQQQHQQQQQQPQQAGSRHQDSPRRLLNPPIVTIDKSACDTVGNIPALFVSSESDSNQEATCSGSDTPTKPNGLAGAMQLLKKEMASLIDQDLALMRQLLTLNEQIEELKWQRKLCVYSRDTLASSATLDYSRFSLTDTESELRASGPHLPDMPPKYPTPSSLSLFSEQHSANNSTDTLNGPLTSSHSRLQCAGAGEARYDVRNLGTNRNSRCSKCMTISETDLKATHGDQHSFDSGIHEPELVPHEVLL